MRASRELRLAASLTLLGACAGNALPARSPPDPTLVAARRRGPSAPRQTSSASVQIAPSVVPSANSLATSIIRFPEPAAAELSLPAPDFATLMGVAETEAGLALEALISRFPRFSLLPQEIPWGKNTILRGPKALWLEL